MKQILFESLAFDPENNISGLEISRIARAKGFPKYADSVLSKEFEKASLSEDMAYLFDLHLEERILSKFYSEGNVS